MKAASSMQLEVWQERFRDHLRLRQFSPRTIEGHVRELLSFLDYLESEGVERLMDVNREHLEGYRTALFHRRYRGKRLKMQTQAAKLCRVRCFLRFLVQERYLLIDPSKDLKMPKLETTLPRVILTEEEVDCLMAVPDPDTPLGLRDRAILELLYGTAIRNTETRELRMEALDLGGHLLQIRQGKGNKSRVVPLGEEAHYWLQRYLREGRPQLTTRLGERRVFLSKSGRCIARANLAHMVRRNAARAGIEKTVTPHVLRHSCATHMLRRGANIRHLQELLGHAQVSTTQVYTKLELSDLQWAHRQFHPRGRER